MRRDAKFDINYDARVNRELEASYFAALKSALLEAAKDFLVFGSRELKPDQGSLAENSPEEFKLTIARDGLIPLSQLNQSKDRAAAYIKELEQWADSNEIDAALKPHLKSLIEVYIKDFWLK